MSSFDKLRIPREGIPSEVEGQGHQEKVTGWLGVLVTFYESQRFYNRPQRGQIQLPGG